MIKIKPEKKYLYDNIPMSLIGSLQNSNYFSNKHYIKNTIIIIILSSENKA